jgi:hypothetical protein
MEGGFGYGGGGGSVPSAIEIAGTCEPPVVECRLPVTSAMKRVKLANRSKEISFFIYIVSSKI